MAAPSFVLSGPAGTLVAEGIRTGYDDVAAASAALADGSADLVVGALPFDVRSTAALLTPVTVADALPAWPATALPAVRIAETLPSPEEHRARIRAALEQLTTPESALQKVVLARGLRLVADGALDEREIVRRLVGEVGRDGWWDDVLRALNH